MATDLFDELAISDIPPPPPQLERRVHARLNRALLVHQLLDFVVGLGPYLAVHLAQAAGAVLHYTFFGRYPRRPGGNKT